MTQGFGLTATARAALLQRLSKRRAEPDAAAPAESPGRDLSTLPGARDIEMVREAGAALGLESPYFRPHDGVAGAHTSIGNRDYINFSSYNYLGLNGDPRVAAAAKAAIDRHGVSASASRLASGERPVHAELEAALAAHHGAEACLAFVSGHATNVTVVGQLLGPRDLILHDQLIHNSVAEGARLSGARRLAFPHNDWRAAERELAAQRRKHGRALIVIEGHYSMDGDIPDLAPFVEMARRHDALLMVDEAHSTGVVGATGRGIAEQCGVPPDQVDIWMGTLSKTLSACGGYIAGRRQLIDLLRHAAPGFVYSVGLAPPLAAAALESLRILEAEPWRAAALQANARRFLEQAREAGFETGASAGLGIVPVILGSSVLAARMAAALFEAGINVQPILYPVVPERSARLRFFLSSEHSAADLDRAVEALVEARQAITGQRLMAS
ncbi:aminotransferase class I/II-fold pyridoxal phosphate-dependent enzyme [Siccirubricoccus sp. KC 17139]|uniref:Aminotransferase class I/II-fold pyridoxal phosphate-dependent enzyme n=1 Tax=Siccirubricoccus soli TaxID=2899147 RepID=A0ABT1DD47_9PROT|nr:aminotransferase class I/II-fold pyridoxal phosphate-dependent enzyme [Siccirubricoccus soli]MCO6419857.1 aminotransferase class I/II-fold pyridoxal phosphate-dependent enzyme [Siccirubricoccus soli]MCP2685992.1 aminotransferase class I/II-fold pyridoxal phosphate-dependent enzyme [Siccirubricoccus soli]